MGPFLDNLEKSLIWIPIQTLMTNVSPVQQTRRWYACCQHAYSSDFRKYVDCPGSRQAPHSLPLDSGGCLNRSKAPYPVPVVANIAGVLLCFGWVSDQFQQGVTRLKATPCIDTY